MSIVIVDYHKGNLLSVERGLVGAGADVVVTDKADVIRAADAVVLPGSVLKAGTQIGNGETWGGVPALRLKAAQAQQA